METQSTQFFNVTCYKTQNLGILDTAHFHDMVIFIIVTIISLSKVPYLIEVSPPLLTHWERLTHICICKLNSIGSGNGLSPGWRQAIIWTNAG